MSAYIKELTEQEFRQQALVSKDNSSAMFENKSYKQGLTFSIPMKRKALKYCQKLIEKNLSSFLVQGTYCFTVWIEKEERNVSTIEQPNVQHSSVVSAPQNIAQKVPTKKITRVYRGQTYEVEIADYDNVQPLQNKPKARRKYRGQYID